MLAVQWEYLLGKSFASAWESGRTEAEWPPHPDRVFQALVAAWGGMGEPEDGREVLEKIEGLPPPEIVVPVSSCGDDDPRAYPETFVPVNDVKTPKITEQGITTLPDGRPRKGRRFPSRPVPSGCFCFLVWPDSVLDDGRRASLARLCRAVTHIGMERSLVAMRLADDPLSEQDGNYIRYRPSGRGAERFRVPYRGRLADLREAYAGGGKDWRRPPVAKWERYEKLGASDRPVPHSVFDSRDWIVYVRREGARFSLAEAPAVAETLRRTLIRAADGDAAAEELISGHRAGGGYLERPHAAFVPLGFVGHTHADGHLLGIAIILPGGLSYDESIPVKRAVAEAEDADGKLRLTFGKAGTVSLVREQRVEPPRTLLPRTWCGPSRVWASVTPVVCDRMPPRPNRYDAWVDGQIRSACQRIGLPDPAEVEVSSVSFLAGAPSCKSIRPLERRSDRQPRWHVHTRIVFAEEVRGPVLLGAGRYRGYGICKPVLEAGREEMGS